MKHPEECGRCPFRDRDLKTGRKVKRRLLWHYIKAKLFGESLEMPCWARKRRELAARQRGKSLNTRPPMVAPGTQPSVNRPPGGPPLRSGPSGDTGQPGAS